MSAHTSSALYAKIWLAYVFGIAYLYSQRDDRQRETDMAYAVTTKDQDAYLAGFEDAFPYAPIWTQDVRAAKLFARKPLASAQGTALYRLGAQQQPVWVGA